MLLRKWLAEKNIRQADFAVMIGVRQSMVSQLASGKRQPSLELTLKIEQVTRGKVTLSDWVREECG